MSALAVGEQAVLITLQTTMSPAVRHPSLSQGYEDATKLSFSLAATDKSHHLLGIAFQWDPACISRMLYGC